MIRTLYGKPESAKRGGQSGLLKTWFASRKPAARARGTVENYLDRIGVAIIRWERGALKKGETIRIEGPQTKILMEAGSLQINRVDVARVKRGDEFGIKVPTPDRPGDKIY